MVHTKGFYITSPGDNSVGIPSVTWAINGGFYFRAPDELAAFKSDLATLFQNHVADDAWVETFEEREQFLEVERKYMTPPDEQGTEPKR